MAYERSEKDKLWIAQAKARMDFFKREFKLRRVKPGHYVVYLQNDELHSIKRDRPGTNWRLIRERDGQLIDTLGSLEQLKISIKWNRWMSDTERTYARGIKSA